MTLRTGYSLHPLTQVRAIATAVDGGGAAEAGKVLARAGLSRLPLGLRRRIWFLLRQRRVLHLTKPRTFNEKVNWRIVYDRRQIIAWTCDKLLVKEYGSSHGVSVPKTYWRGTDLEELLQLELPSRWVLKPNHTSGRVYFGSNPIDVPHLKRLTERWLEKDQRAQFGEWAYAVARPLLVVEEMLGGGALPPDDIRFFVFNGRVACVQIDVDRLTHHRRGIYTPEWRPLPVVQSYPPVGHLPRPPQLDRMLAVAEELGSDFDFIRVDLYCVEDEIYLGELTPYPTSGLQPYAPRRFDRWLGSYWHLPAL